MRTGQCQIVVPAWYNWYCVGNLLAHEGLIWLSCMGLMWTNWCCREEGYEGGKQSGATVVFVRAFAVYSARRNYRSPSRMGLSWRQRGSNKYEGKVTAAHEVQSLHPNTCENPPRHSSCSFPSAAGGCLSACVLDGQHGHPRQAKEFIILRSLWIILAHFDCEAQQYIHNILEY
jgi:hypothetical protein